MKKVLKILIPIALATCAASQDTCSDYNIECSPGEKCVFIDLCLCHGGDYQVTATLPCDERCAGGYDLICRDESYKSRYNDTCDYRPGDLCENKCNFALDDCHCGGKTFNIRDSKTFCCDGNQQKMTQPCQSSEAIVINTIV